VLDQPDVIVVGRVDMIAVDRVAGMTVVD